LEVSAAFFPSLKQNLMETYCHFLGMPESQTEQCALLLNKTLLNNWTFWSLIPNSQGLDGLYLIYA